MSGPPVVVTEGLGRPVTNVASLNGATPMVVVESLGEPVTLVDALGEPVTLLNADGTLYSDEEDPESTTEIEILTRDGSTILTRDGATVIARS
jgi:hypothetical protein